MEAPPPSLHAHHPKKGNVFVHNGALGTQMTDDLLQAAGIQKWRQKARARAKEKEGKRRRSHGGRSVKS